MSGEKKLNRQQLAAVHHGSGPLLIIAGAGTGKTTVITERVRWLISRHLALPEEILALTFTEKASREMEERIDLALPLGFTQMWVMTFHAFCDRLLRDEGLHIGLSSNFRLLTEADSVALLRRHLFSLPADYFRPLGNPAKFIGSLLQHFSRLQDEDITPAEYLSWASSQPDLASADPTLQLDARKNLELAHLYSRYTEIKEQAGVLDYGDLIAYTLRLFRLRPNILKIYRQKFKYLLVDEFQDTNYAQNQLLLLLAGKTANLTVVADDDQSIYRWRGAAVSNVLQFRRTYPACKLVVLTQNFRSTQEILDRSYSLIQNNNPDRLEVAEKIDKHLTSARHLPGEPVKFFHLERGEQEADAVAREIRRLLDLPGSPYAPRDFAVLVRANAHADPFARSLAHANLPFQFLGPGELFHQPEVKDLIAYLYLLNNLEDDPSAYRVFSSAFFALSPRDLATLGSFARRYHLPLFTAAEIVTRIKPFTAPLPEFPSGFTAPLTDIVNLVHRHLGQLPQASAGQILFAFLQDSGLLRAVTDYSPPFNETSSANVVKFFNKLKSFEFANSDASVPAVVNWIELATEIGESPAASDVDWSANDAVSILTLHSAKGLEFPVVFLVNLVSLRFPSQERREPLPVPDALIKEILPRGDFHLQEERRLFYVGMTRARDLLYLTAADYYGVGKRAKSLSPFITEALGNVSSAVSSSDQLSLLDWQSPAPKSSLPALPHPVKVDYLSYSQIQTFLDCPLHYKAKYLLKLPSPPHAASSFGNTIHLSLREFYEQVRRGTSPDILEIYARNWIPEGYLHRRQADDYFAKGQAFLSDYVKREFDPRRLPLKLEEPFTVSLGPLKIGGKIDRVDALPDGGIEIVDYKTGAHSLTPKQAATDLQLSFYALAATLLPTPPFHQPPGNIRLTLYYFDEHKKVSTTRTAAQLGQARLQILSYADAIAHSDFKCSGSPLCKSCDFKMLCDFAAVDS